MREEKMLDKKMLEKTDTVLCAGVDDLVAYLYGEANEKEARSFQTHLGDCATCRAELAAFGEVREGVVAWRDEALNPMALNASNAVATREPVKAMPGRSALGALREFFALSPLWLRGATAFAALLFVALLFVTTLRFFERPENQIAQQAPSAPVIANETANGNARANEPVVEQRPVNAAPANGEMKHPPQPNTRADKVVARSNSNRRDKVTIMSNEERSQLSDQLSDLLIAANEDEENVPRLYDLLYESN